MSKQLLSLLFVLSVLISCKKTELLQERSNTSLLVPTTIQDMQELLDNDKVFAPGTALNFLSADEFYYTDAFTNQLSASELGTYAWLDFEFKDNEAVPDWNNAYEQVYYVNNVLEGIKQMKPGATNQKRVNALQGDALFKRAYAFYNLAQVFTLPYDASYATENPGIPLRLTINPKETIARGTLQQTYNQIIADLLQANPLLPQSVEWENRNRASQPAALAMLARVHLSMGAYINALNYANQCLALYDSLIDYNDLSTAVFFPLSQNNKETLYQSKMAEGGTFPKALFNNNAFIDSSLVRLYQPGDLRPYIYFNQYTPGAPARPKGSYYKEITPFTGLAMAEVYLIAAECEARTGNTSAAMKYLNRLLVNRCSKGQFTDLTANSTTEALNLILAERKKELVLRGLRWTDVRRLSLFTETRITLTRTVHGITYTLAPGSLRYALPIPAEVIRYNNIKQNPR